MKAQLPWRTRFARPVHLVNQADDQMHLEEKQADDQGTEMHSSILPALIRQWLPWQTRITSAMIFEENEPQDDGTHIHSSLLPGLPHDIALRCLVRLPFRFLGICRTVSKSWNDAIQPRNMVTLRQQAGLSTNLVFFFAEKNIAGTLHLFLIAIDSLFHTVSEIPCPYCLLSHEVRFEMILGMHGEVLCLGKDEKLDKLLPQLFVLDYLRARWRSLPSMAKLTGGNFGLISVTIGEYAYFTWGWSSRDFHNVNKKFECLDLSTKHWRTIPNRHYLRL
ncbi:hypothetical protein GOP47_0010112 [Adiantum capillus-veneris]|uniref:F-box domain-containing protein n=1 Tax=Adiantum capillus-veneris TaxID=13818 RepID=A0A9D4UU69_ADICA|nr:hypothetical protein GOP47_0010112 [Adiantum capillus-veneris]